MSAEEELRELLNLRASVDEIVERAQNGHASLADVLGELLPTVAKAVGAAGMFLESYDEDLELQVFRHPADLVVPNWDTVCATTSEERREPYAATDGRTRVIAQRIDVAGTWFGRAGFVLAQDAPVTDAVAATKLDNVCEVLDNYLFALRAAREKHAVMMELGAALRHRVLGEGLSQAEVALARALPLERMLMVFVAEDAGAGATLHVRLYEKGKVTFDTLGGRGDAELVALGRSYLFKNDDGLLRKLAFQNAQEEVLIDGVTNGALVGKVLAASSTGHFNTFDREILAGFAGYVRQRIVDFNKEWRRLAASFCPEDVARLVGSEDYERRFLLPREETVGILYVDIAGFTHLSEQVLKTPSGVAKLVEEWGAEAVNLVWKHGGVFDKMVGDCVIALFGPPFYEDGLGTRLARALACAKDIRAMTEAFPQRPGFEALRASGLNVSTGVNLAPLFVGTFGPNSNFTGFSAGMNNTARLQGCATRGRILVMDDGIAKLDPGHGFSFGEIETAQVKNVAQPLRFRELK
jgi:class 3 adenylate cyclase